MKKIKKTLAFLLSLGLTVSMLAGCGSKTNETTAAADAQTESAADEKESGADESGSAAATTSDKTYKIGVLQYVQHDALDASNEGFFAALDDLGIKYDADQQNAREETRHGDDHARVCAPFGREGRVCLLEQLDERDVDHHAAREAQRERKQPFVGAFSEEGDRAADARGEARAECQQQGDEDIVFFHTNRFRLFGKYAANRPGCRVFHRKDNA